MKNEEYSFKSDVWSIGICAIELCEKNPPHKDIPSALRVIFYIINVRLCIELLHLLHQNLLKERMEKRGRKN